MSQKLPAAFSRWRPPTLTALFRGQRVPPVRQVGGRPPRGANRRVQARIARVEGAVAGQARWECRSGCRLSLPEASVYANSVLNLVERTLVARLLRSSRATRAPISFAFTPDGRPKPGPLTDREIDAALELVSDMPFEELQERGWHVQPNHWCWPLNDAPFLRRHPGAVEKERDASWRRLGR